MKKSDILELLPKVKRGKRGSAYHREWAHRADVFTRSKFSDSEIAWWYERIRFEVAQWEYDKQQALLQRREKGEGHGKITEA